MTNDTGNENTNARHWKRAGIGGVVVAVLLMAVKGMGLVSAAMSGAVVAAVAGYVLTRMVGNRDVGQMAREAWEEPDAMSLAAAEAGASEPAAAAEPSVETASEAPAPAEPQAAEVAPEAPARISASPLVKPSKPLPGQQELAARNGTWRYQGAAT